MYTNFGTTSGQLLKASATITFYRPLREIEMLVSKTLDLACTKLDLCLYQTLTMSWRVRGHHSCIKKGSSH